MARRLSGGSGFYWHGFVSWFGLKGVKFGPLVLEQRPVFGEAVLNQTDISCYKIYSSSILEITISRQQKYLLNNPFARKATLYRTHELVTLHRRSCLQFFHQTRFSEVSESWQRRIRRGTILNELVRRGAQYQTRRLGNWSTVGLVDMLVQLLVESRSAWRQELENSSTLLKP